MLLTGRTGRVGAGYAENDGSFFIRLAGDGSGASVLAAASEFTSRNGTTVAASWRDSSDPKARAILDNCVGGGVNQRKHDIPDVAARARQGAETEEAAIVAMLAQVRELRIEPPVTRPAGVTDVKLMRVQVRASVGRLGIVIRR